MSACPRGQLWEIHRTVGASTVAGWQMALMISPTEAPPPRITTPCSLARRITG